ncbi:MAG: glutamate-cysteine ligase family protein [Gammaproteobacteria bacterium]|nr:glutamate-cysteine ligase family protein [Gammaproteobacteria bacterium]
MGDEIQRRHFDAEDFRRFRRNLDSETHLVSDLFERDELSGRGDMVGFELEAWIVNADGHPHPVNERLLEIVANPLVVPELAAFNVELNGSPSALQGNVFSRIHDELSATWDICRSGAAELGCRLATIGILPTIRPELLNSAHMSAMVRYQALNDRILALRDGAPLHINITTGDGLDMHHDDVMLEAAATSFQIHLQCKPERAVRDFNAAIIASAPMVALAANSPFLFGRSLWEETRIPLFEQAVSAGPRAPARVTFGTGYAKDSLAEIFAENQREHPILLPFVQPDEPPHKYAHVRFQNGTVWRWNRPLLGFDFDGVPHLRIEHRVVPAGPTIQDCVANAAAWLGMVRGLVDANEPAEHRIDFATASDNFYAAAKHGLDAELTWLDGEQVTAGALLQDELLPLAAGALERLDIPQPEVDRYVGTALKRVAANRTGARWQRAWVAKHGADWAALTRAYIDAQESGEPVHTWSL